MSITIQMGVNPIPTCVISLSSYSYENGNMSANFDYTLNSISGYDYWGYGVKLEYGATESLGSTEQLIPLSTNRWSAKSGRITINKTNVTSSPQYFYFRLNSLAATEATPGNIGAYSINVDIDDKPTEIEGANNFVLEQTTSAWFTPKKSSFIHNLYIDLINSGNTWVTRQNYTSGATITISDSEILNAYRQISNCHPNQTVSVKYYLETIDNGKNLGGTSLWKTMTVNGTSKININNSWKNAIPYININGVWKPTIAYIKNNNWNRC